MGDTMSEPSGALLIEELQAREQRVRELVEKWDNRVTSIRALFPGDQAAERVEICKEELQAALAGEKP